jgi:HK97 family phage prohead protease
LDRTIWCSAAGVLNAQQCDQKIVLSSVFFMPCIKCENGKWKFGERGNCTFDTLAACRRAEAAYYAEQTEGASMSESQKPCGTVVDPVKWRAEASMGGAGTDVILRKEFVSEVEADDKTRTVKFTITTGLADREKDVISPNGWNVDHYLANPVVLFAHDYDSLPVARTVNLEKHQDRLVATAEFASAELNPMAEQVYQMLKQGFLRGASVGFRPMEFNFNEDRGGVDFEQQELLEFSVVPVPANPEALMSAGMKAENVSQIKAWAKQTLEQLDALDSTPKQEPGEERVSMAKANKLIDKLRKDLNRIDDISKKCIVGIDAYQNSLRRSDDGALEKGVTPSNPTGFGLASMDTPWKRPTLTDFTSESWEDLTTNERKAIAKHFAWALSSTPATYGDLKLPHHRGNGDAVWRGVAAAAGRLGQSQIPTADDAGVRTHLAKHYRQFDHTAPWERDGAGWSAYRKAVQRATVESGVTLTNVQLAHLLDDHGFQDEAVAILSWLSDGDEGDDGVVAAPAPVETLRATADRIDMTLAQINAALGQLGGAQPAPLESDDDYVVELADSSDDEMIDLDKRVDLARTVRDALSQSVGTVVGSEVRSAINAMRGRIN